MVLLKIVILQITIQHRTLLKKVQNFIKSYKAKYNEDPSAFSALGYDAAYIVKASIEKAGSTDKKAVVEAMKNINYDGVTGQLTFDAKNNPVKAVTIIKVVDGTTHLIQLFSLNS